MAGLGITKDQSHNQDSLPTPLRQRGRASTPAPDATGTRSRDAPVVDASGLAPAAWHRQTDTAVAGSSSSPAPHGRFHGKGTRVCAALLLVCVVFFIILVPAPEKSRSPKVAPPKAKADATHVAKPAASLLDRIAKALACPGPRADIVDILAGAPYEYFQKNIPQSQEAQAFRLPQLVAQVTKEANTVGMTRAETELQETVLQLAGTGGGWPTALRDRLLSAIDGQCKAAPDEGAPALGVPAASATPMEVDMAHTSPGTVSVKSGWVQQSLLNFGASTGIPYLQRRADWYKSRPATVVVSSQPIQPRDCFALRGKAAVALRVVGQPSVIRHIVIEQLPRWVARGLWSLPGQFEVWGEPASAADAPEDVDPYTVPLGSFEYFSAAPAPQAFVLKNPVSVRGLKLVFKEPTDRAPEHFFCIYRLRAFESLPPSRTEATTIAPARLAFPVQG